MHLFIYKISKKFLINPIIRIILDSNVAKVDHVIRTDDIKCKLGMNCA